MSGSRLHLVAMCMVVAAGSHACGGRVAAAPPNVVVILADDLGFSDLGCYGGEIDTPHLDRLAAGGLRFTQGYNTARCWPSRAALLTGYYAQSIHRDALPRGTGGTECRRPAWARLLPELLAAAGYRSYHSGKWHIDGDPRRQGFSRTLRVNPGGENDYFDPVGATVDGRPIEAGGGYYVTTAIGEHAVACLQDHAARHSGLPFFSYVAFTAPHFPLQAPQELVAKYANRYLAGWDAVRAARFERLAAGDLVRASLAPLEPQLPPFYDVEPSVLARFGAGEIDRSLPWAELTPEQRAFQATKMAIYAAMIEMMDRAVGRIVGQLEAMQAIDDTLILFLSDNGSSAEILIRGKGHDPTLPLGAAGTFPCLGPGWSSCANTPFRRHKMWVHEGGIATPWIAHWPRGIAAANALRTQPVHVIDVVPTVLELAGVVPPPEHAGTKVPPLQGRSFAACFSDPAAPPPHETLWWCHEGNRAVRVGDWKLVAAKGDPWELYDLAGDRTETSNLAAAQPERVATLEREWNAVSAECRQLADLDTRRPNIIYVMTDDQGYGDIAALGNPVLATPNLDRMHRESVRLTEFHVSPTCAPTRAALLTGRHEFRSGVTHTVCERERLALSAVTLPELLRRRAGYATGIFGKWHLGDEDAYQPGSRGFDRVFIHGGGGIGQSYPGSCGDAPGNTYFDPVIRSDGTFVKTKGYCTDVFFDAALAWIDGRRKTGEPFFCVLTPNAPHDPLDCPTGSDTPWLAPLEAAGIADPKVRGRVAKFYGMIANIDANMGRLLGRLDEWGLAENTLVVFTTDNGTATGAPVFNAGMRGQKGTVYRGGTRVPVFWRWQGTLPAGMDVPELTAHVDVLPTLCDVAGIALPQAVEEKVEGRSFLPLLQGARAAWPDRPLVTHVGRWDRGQAAQSAYRNCRIREGRWSLVNTRNRPDGWELYDIASDPAEQHDRAAAQPEIVKRLAATYDAWWRSVQPDLVNEDLDGPAENPFKTAYRKQFDQPPATRPAAEGRSPRQPNIVFFLCDDLGSGDLGCTGSRDIQTPSIDALFARGTRLSRHWAGSAVCAPSRCVLMTGRHPGHAAIRSNREVQPEGQVPLPAGTVTLVNLLRAAGYATGGFGKWGLGAPGSDSDPIACGFESFFGFNCQRQAHTYYPRHLWDGRSRVPLDGTQYAADLIAERQLAFIKANAGRPFFLYMPTTVPHLALQVPADEPSLADYERHFGAETPYLGGNGYVPCPRPLATYAAMITRMDREVGRIVKELDDLGLTDDTIFVFSSDNGATWPGLGGIDTARLASNGALRDWKGSPYEGGLRVPTVAVWPGHIPAGRTIEAPTGFEDWLPTLLDLAGLRDRIPSDIDGVSLAAALQGKEPPPERLLYRELTERRWQAALDTNGRWKAVRKAVGTKRSGQGATTELYDLAADPGETTDVAAGHPDMVARMEAILAHEHVPHPDWPLARADVESRAQTHAAAGVVRPNVVIIFVDDLGYGDIGPFGCTKHATPVLDRMAAQGMKLTSFYAAPVCSVSRAQLLTGCYGLRVGVPWVYYPADPHGLHPAEVTLAERLKALGYTTACIGKWHLGDQPEFLPTRQGFDRYYGIPYSNDMQRVSLETGERVVPLLRNDKVAELLTDEMQAAIVEKTTAEAVRFIEEAQDEPFFLYMPHTAVHAPLVPGKDFRGTSANGAFGDWVAELDWSVGEVLGAIERRKLSGQTLVIFTSDNGPWVSVVGERTSAGPLRGSKGSTWEGGVRVPTIAWWPGRIPAGMTCDTVAGTIDLLPTIVTIAGGVVSAEPVIDGRDMSGLLFGTSREPPRLAHYYFARDGLQAVRQGSWKLAIAPQAGGMGPKNTQPPEPASLDAPRLYDLDRDIGETTNVAAGHPEIVAGLRALAVAMQQELGRPDSPARRPAGRVADPQTIYPTAAADRSGPERRTKVVRPTPAPAG